MQIAELQLFSTSDSSMTANKEQVLANSSHTKYLRHCIAAFSSPGTGSCNFMTGTGT